MKLKNTVIFATGLATALPTAAFAQQDQTIDEIVVLGTKIPKTITEMTNSVTIVNEVEIENRAFTDVSEILRAEAGVEFKQNGGPGQFNYLKLRGMASANVLVVIDGIKINRPSGGDTRNLLSQIDPNSIESIEILRGPQATLYGANSTAGVIVINTKSGNSPDLGLGIETGSLGWERTTGTLRGGVDTGAGQWLYSANLSSTESDNTHRHEFFDDTAIQLKTSFEAERWSIAASRFDVDNTFGYAELDTVGFGDTFQAFQTPDPHQRSTTTEVVDSLTFDFEILEGLTFRTIWGEAENTYAIEDIDNGFLGEAISAGDGSSGWPDYIPFSAGDTLYIYDGSTGVQVAPIANHTPGSNTAAFYKDDSEQWDIQLIYQTDYFNLLLGADDQEYSAKQWGSYGVSSNDDGQSSVYVNGDVTLLEGALVLSAGLRDDDYDSWGEHDTYNFGFAYSLTDSTQFYGNVGDSFKPATMFQLFSPRYGDPSLTPEEGDTWELGIRQQLGDYTNAEVTFWVTTVDGVIYYDGSRPSLNDPSLLGTYNNGAEAQSTGVEIQFDHQINDAFSLSGNYTYTDSEQRSVGGSFQDTAQIARNKGNLRLDYASGDLTLGVNAYYSDDRLSYNRLNMPSYVRVDVSGRYELNDNLSFSARVENLFDEDIVEGIGYEEPGTYGIVGVDFRF